MHTVFDTKFIYDCFIQFTNLQISFSIITNTVEMCSINCEEKRGGNSPTITMTNARGYSSNNEILGYISLYS